MARRTGPSGRGRHVDQQRTRRGSALPPLGDGLTYDKSDRITLSLGGGLIIERGSVKLDVEEPLSVASPLKLNLGDSVEVRNGKIEAKKQVNNPITLAGSGLQIERSSLGNEYSVLSLKASSVGIKPLGLSISDPPSQGQVQAISDKVDEIIGMLIASGQLPDASTLNAFSIGFSGAFN